MSKCVVYMATAVRSSIQLPASSHLQEYSKYAFNVMKATPLARHEVVRTIVVSSAASLLHQTLQTLFGCFFFSLQPLLDIVADFAEHGTVVHTTIQCEIV